MMARAILDPSTVDVWDADTWLDLRTIRDGLRDRLFDEAQTLTDAQANNIEQELERVETDISNGLTKEIPF